MEKNIMDVVLEQLETALINKAPHYTGNLRNAIKSKPFYSPMEQGYVIRLGSEWQTKSNKTYGKNGKYYYAGLLNDKRVIKNRESKNKKNRMENRRNNNNILTRDLIVRDDTNGKILRMSEKQFNSQRRTYVNKKKVDLNTFKTVNQKTRVKQDKKYTLLSVDWGVPIKKAPIPMRVNRHYHYVDDVVEDMAKRVAIALGGKLKKGLDGDELLTVNTNKVALASPLYNKSDFDD